MLNECSLELKDKCLVRTEATYQLDEDFVLHENVEYRVKWNRLWSIILIFLIASTLLLWGKGLGEEKTEEKTEEYFTNEALGEDICVKIEEVSIFDRCSTEYLSEDEITSICQKEAGAEILQQVINMMYARHGQEFMAGGKVDVYFRGQEWYQQIEKEEVTYEDLNLFEQKNSDLIVSILEEAGYR